MEKVKITYAPLYDAILRDTTLKPVDKLILTKCIGIWRHTHRLNFSLETMADWVGVSKDTVKRSLHALSDCTELKGVHGLLHINVCKGNTKKTASEYTLNEQAINKRFGVGIFSEDTPIYRDTDNNSIPHKDDSPPQMGQNNELCGAAETQPAPTRRHFNKVK